MNGEPTYYGLKLTTNAQAFPSYGEELAAYVFGVLSLNEMELIDEGLPRWAIKGGASIEVADNEGTWTAGPPDGMEWSYNGDPLAGEGPLLSFEATQPGWAGEMEVSWQEITPTTIEFRFNRQLTDEEIDTTLERAKDFAVEFQAEHPELPSLEFLGARHYKVEHRVEELATRGTIETDESRPGLV